MQPLLTQFNFIEEFLVSFEGREEPAIAGQDATRLVDHEKRLFEGVYDPLRLDMFRCVAAYISRAFPTPTKAPQQGSPGR